MSEFRSRKSGHSNVFFSATQCIVDENISTSVIARTRRWTKDKRAKIKMMSLQDKTLKYVSFPNLMGSDGKK